MKFSAREEYGIRCLLRIARFYEVGKSLTIPEISKGEGISQHSTAKILRVLRISGFLESERGHIGGYALSRSPDEIVVGEVLSVLGGKLYDDDFCQSHAKKSSLCTISIDCSIRSLWMLIQDSVDQVVNNMKLSDLMGSENLFENNPKKKLA